MIRRVTISAVVVTIATLVFLAGSAFGFSNGVGGNSGNPSTGGATCASCHSGGVTPTVSLTGPAVVVPGSTSTYTITIAGGQAAGGGFDVSSTSGVLAAPSADTKILGSEIVHSGTKAADAGGLVSWTFDWTAPAAPGAATLYAVGNSVDGASNTGGDASAAATLAITIQAPANQAPTAVVSGNLQGAPQEGIRFDGSGSTDADGTIVSYLWDFGDGSPTVDFGVVSAILQHSYLSAGTYTATLTVADDVGATNVASTIVTITAGTPPPPPTVPAPTTTTTTTAAPPATTTTPAPTTTAPATTTPDAGAAYGSFCASCHGASGQGGAGPSLVTSNASLARISAVITGGSGSMPGFGPMLTPGEVDAVSKLVAGFQSSTPAPTTTIAAAATGADIYASSCASCHGSTGAGGVGPSLVDSPASAAVVGSIVANGVGTMPGFSDRLTAEQIQLVGAHVASIAPSIDATGDDSDDGTDGGSAGATDPGAALFALNCSSCHGANGEGGSADALNVFFEDDELISAIQRGPSEMPRFSDLLSEAEIRLIADYVHELEVGPDTAVAGAVATPGPSASITRGPTQADLDAAVSRAGASASGLDDGPDFPFGAAAGIFAAMAVLLALWFVLERRSGTSAGISGLGGSQ